MENIGVLLQKFRERGGEKARGAAAKVEAEVAEHTGRIQDLHDKRLEVEALPMTQGAVLEICKRELNEGLRKEFVKNLLVPHVQGVKDKKWSFLWEPILSKDFTNERRIGFWLYAILNETLLEEAVKQLPADGISEVDRTRKLEKIDSEISKLEAELEKLLS